MVQRPSLQSKWWTATRFWLGIAVGLLAVYAIARDVQWHQVTAVLSGADPLFLLLALGSILLTTWAKAIRWRLLFHPGQARLSVKNCAAALLAGQLANNVLPARLGDLVRVYLLGESSGTGKMFALATLVVEKAMDSVMLLLLIALLSMWMPLPFWLRRSSLLVSGILGILLVVLLIVANQRGRIVRILQSWIARHPALSFLRVVQNLAEASGELEALRKAWMQAQLWGWSFLIWGIAVLTNVLVFWSLHQSFDLLAPPLLLAVLMTGAILPTSPLQLGVFHYLCFVTLSLFGIAQDTALGYAVLLHLVVFLPIVIGGFFGLSGGIRSQRIPNRGGRNNG
ncbi:MAG: flippase-like domain-containing protein [Chloroflexi bacterium]|nr:flippase-like domain-containing protein [Chloroflexota bacterium]